MSRACNVDKGNVHIAISYHLSLSPIATSHHPAASREKWEKKIFSSNIYQRRRCVINASCTFFSRQLLFPLSRRDVNIIIQKEYFVKQRIFNAGESFETEKETHQCSTFSQHNQGNLSTRQIKGKSMEKSSLLIITACYVQICGMHLTCSIEIKVDRSHQPN